MTPLLAVSQQQRIGLVVVVVMTIGWFIYLLSSARRTYEPGVELTTAPNRKPYFDDEGLEGRRLTKYLWWAFAMLAISAVGLPIYWVREPFRQKGAGLDRGVKYFDQQSVLRGEEYFQATPGDPPTPREPHYGCETCHGKKGIGGSATFTLTDPANPSAPARQVTWTAPALNTVMLRFRPEEVLFVLTYGRAGTPMPPWGVNGGGALDDQQLQDLINYLTSIQLDPKDVKQANVDQYGTTDGAKLFDAFCARCHTQGYSYGEPSVPGGGAYGPDLTGGATLRQFPTVAQQISWVTDTVEIGKQYGQRGISSGRMPHFGNMLTEDQISAIVAYERTL
ncbi:MAG TPA: c-type cytochrome [Acidimicrobiales bacterium]|nr:c-type cytochrome [Acidimicrobiales bacterium]